jgi:hypothetical protein
MRFAYADPPYPGRAKRYYGSHPDYKGEVDHEELIGRLCRDYPDGWALSTGPTMIQDVLGLCPAGVRVGIWHNTNSKHPGAINDWWWCWEPVIICGGRRSQVRALTECGASGQAGRFVGAKPAQFTRWVLGLLGAVPEDTVDDIFPGSGAVGLVIEEWRSQPVLPGFRVLTPRENAAKYGRKRNAADFAKTHEALFD